MNPNYGMGVFHPASFPMPQQPVMTSTMMGPQSGVPALANGVPTGMANGVTAPNAGVGVWHPASFPMPQMPVTVNGANGMGMGCFAAPGSCLPMANGESESGFGRMLPWLIIAGLVAYMVWTSKKRGSGGGE